MSVSYEIGIDEELWNSFEALCEQGGVDPYKEIKQIIEEYIVSVKEENEEL